MVEKIHKNNLTAVILAGGRARRMGGVDKGLIVLRNKPLIGYVAEAIAFQVGQVLISANRNIAQYQQFGTVISDELADFQGPLAGISKALSVAQTPYLLVVPCDAPRLNRVLLARFAFFMSRHNCAICVASDGANIQPTFALIQTHLAHNLAQFLHRGGRKLGAWLAENGAHSVDFSDYPQLFLNVNTPQDLAKMEAVLSQTSIE